MTFSSVALDVASGVALCVAFGPQQGDALSLVSAPIGPKRLFTLLRAAGDPTPLAWGVRSSAPLPAPASPARSASHVPPSRIAPRAAWLQARLTKRDWAILETVYRLGHVSGQQIERLHFAGLKYRFTVRKRVLQRLTSNRALTALPRRVGGPGGGSAPTIYVLDPASTQLMRTREGLPHPLSKATRLRGSWLFEHALTVSELYTRLIEAAPSSGYRVAEFLTEPACWWPDGNGGELRPDAYLALAAHGYLLHWWVEVDRGTEGTSTIREKFNAYLAFAHSRQAGPSGSMPGVLVTVPDDSRCKALRRIAGKLPDPAKGLIHIHSFETAVPTLIAALNGTQPHHELAGEEHRP